MALKIGELARRTGLTVRTLHHYDAIGLLKPSARSDAGYRLYGRNDVARLHPRRGVTCRAGPRWRPGPFLRRCFRRSPRAGGY
jgi:hypothetical protein